ncbi:ankyrin repeat-containing domain protein [Aspergillus granulosus]|uniref:Ankyrin repeat-containing domain protein n=1 Tax=Aspergillus granulosus TaxID=176169 RepID=A0ABR4GVK8_9EURO
MVLDMYPQLHLDYALSEAYRTQNTIMLRFLIENAVKLGKRIFLPGPNTRSAAQLVINKAPASIWRTHQECQLLDACKNGDLGTVKRLCELGTSADMETNNGMSPLCYAIRNGHDGVVKELLKHGAPVGSGTGRPMLQDAMALAIRSRQSKVVRTLVNIGVPYNKEWALREAVGGRDVELMALVLPEPNMRLADGKTPLHVASQAGFLEGVALLVAVEARILKDDAGKTPLDYARDFGHNNILALF